MIVRKSLVFAVFLFLVSAQNENDDSVNPEDVDDVKPPIQKDEVDLKKVVNIAKDITTPTSLADNSSTTTTTRVITSNTITNQATNSTSLNITAPTLKPEADKKEELLTGKEETVPPIIEAIGSTVITPVESETQQPEVGQNKKEPVNPEDVDENKTEEVVDKENAAPEFEVKQEVEGGKGEEDPDANVDKPVQDDPPKDEADGAAKEDRESQPIGAEGLHEAVEEARGNLAAGVAVAAEQKKDSTDEIDEQNLNTQPIARPHRLGSKREFEPVQGMVDGEEDGIGFMSFFFVATFLIVFVYVLQHNKKKLLGLMFEGRTSRGSTRRGGNVKYRRLSQSDQNY